ncbi:unnamed protein product [Leptosia nina]|uniref:Major facilitator superfamily (MFS) profile domain-containing protein n=1 Tax=Leptosia nina TaxID=320188 RepID=A0AAV1K264_9NEOP
MSSTLTLYKQKNENDDHQKSSKDPLDNITYKIVGDFGKWQLKIAILMALLKLPMAWYQLNILFLAPPQNFYCVKPKSFTQYTDDEWREMCLPKIEEYPCLIFDPDILSVAPNMDRALIPLVPCKEFVYDTSVFSRTIISDWNLVCTRHWLIHFTQAVMMWGVVCGGIFFPMWADKYGRRSPLMAGIIIQFIAGFLTSVLRQFWAFLISWFILAVAVGGLGVISFVMSIEVVSGKWRTVIPILYQSPFGIGNTILAGLAYFLRDWRHLEFSLGVLSSLFLLYHYLIEESPRWLLATGQTEKACAISLTGLISLPGCLLCLLIITKFGRKTTVCVFQMISSICFVLILLIPKEMFTNDWPRLLVAGIGFAGLSGAVPALYLYSGELFPTLGRNVGVGGVTTFARIASMVAPGIVTLDEVMADLPLILLAIVSFCQLALLVPLPETKGLPLPDTLEDAERFFFKRRIGHIVFHLLVVTTPQRWRKIEMGNIKVDQENQTSSFLRLLRHQSLSGVPLTKNPL